MPGQMVVDASIAIARVHPAQATGETEDVLHEIGSDARFVVPALCSSRSLMPFLSSSGARSFAPSTGSTHSPCSERCGRWSTMKDAVSR